MSTAHDEPEDAPSLYRLRPEEFTAARDALVRRLRKAGEREKAEEIRRLRRPNAAAWALDQVAQGDPSLIEHALAAGNDLREAMEIGDGRRLREAERSSKQASDSVVDQAERMLASAGQPTSEDIRSRMAATLRAAILDPDVAERLRVGTLDRDVELPGFGMEMAVTAPPRPPSPRPKRTQEDRERLEREREEQRRREEARRAARARLSELENEAERLARRAERLAGVADRAEREAREARADATAAATEAEEAAAKVAAARRELDEQDRVG